MFGVDCAVDRGWKWSDVVVRRSIPGMTKHAPPERREYGRADQFGTARRRNSPGGARFVAPGLGAQMDLIAPHFRRCLAPKMQINSLHRRHYNALQSFFRMIFGHWFYTKLCEFLLNFV